MATADKMALQGVEACTCFLGFPARSSGSRRAPLGRGGGGGCRAGRPSAERGALRGHKAGDQLQ